MPPPHDDGSPNQSEASQGQHSAVGFGHQVSVRTELGAGPSHTAAALAAEAKFKALAGRNSDHGPKNG